MRRTGILVLVAIALLAAPLAWAEDDDDDPWADLDALAKTPTPERYTSVWEGEPAPIKAKKASTRASARAKSPVGGNAGVGVIVGAPTGLTAKYRNTPVTAIDAAFAMDDGVYYLHSDYVFEQRPILTGSTATVRWYAGAGARVVMLENRGGTSPSGISMAAGNGNGNGNGNSGGGGGGNGGAGTFSRDGSSTNVHLGARVPLGLTARFAKAQRLELFGELALDVGVVGAEGTDLSGSIGARWFF